MRAPSVLAQLAFVRRGGAVRRYHTHYVHHRETVAEHSWGVAMLCTVLSGGSPRAELLMAALAHDLPEGVVGDIPAPSKRLCGDAIYDREHRLLEEAGLAFDLTDEEARILKLADILDGMTFCCAELERGNRGVAEIFQTYAGYALAGYIVNTVDHDIYDSLLDRWRQHGG